MSDLELRPGLVECGGNNDPVDARTFTALPGREVALTPRWTTDSDHARRGLSVQRYLPTKGRRMVGAWCFVDHFGPDDISADAGMLLGPHPHCGLQTVTWLLEGEILHRDSLENEQTIVPGELNLMTAGTGISHAEESPPQRPPILHGLQLWIALPDAARDMQPAFEHHDELPILVLPGLRAQILIGTLAGVTSPATAHTPIVGAVVHVDPGAGTEDVSSWLPVRRRFEYAVLLLEGELTLDGHDVEPGSLIYLGHGRDGMEVVSTRGARMLLLGGEPFEEEIVMWWNLIARRHDEVVQARALWNAHAPRFGAVKNARAERIPAPSMPTGPLRSRGRS